VGVDSWAVDYGLVRVDGSLLSTCVLSGFAHRAFDFGAKALVGLEAMFERTGIAHQPFNTSFQLMADAASGHLDEANLALLLPDLINYFLTARPRPSSPTPRPRN